MYLNIQYSVSNIVIFSIFDIQYRYRYLTRVNIFSGKGTPVQYFCLSTEHTVKKATMIPSCGWKWPTISVIFLYVG